MASYEFPTFMFTYSNFDFFIIFFSSIANMQIRARTLIAFQVPVTIL